MFDFWKKPEAYRIVEFYDNYKKRKVLLRYKYFPFKVHACLDDDHDLLTQLFSDTNYWFSDYDSVQSVNAKVINWLQDDDPGKRRNKKPKEPDWVQI